MLLFFSLGYFCFTFPLSSPVPLVPSRALIIVLIRHGKNREYLLIAFGVGGKGKGIRSGEGKQKNVRV